MKARLTTLFLSILFLWGSLVAYGQQTYSSKGHQITAATECVNVAIDPASTSEAREVTHFPLTILVNFDYARAYALQQRILYFPPSIQKSVKTYIVFRTLRN